MSDLLSTNTPCPDCGSLAEADLHNTHLGETGHVCPACNHKFYTHLDLRGTDLREQNFSGMILRNADLRGANLDGAIFDSNLLSHANLDGCDLSKTTFEGIKLTGASLIGTMLPLSADLLLVDNADLTDSNIHEVEGRVFYTMNEMLQASTEENQDQPNPNLPTQIIHEGEYIAPDEDEQPQGQDFSGQDMMSVKHISEDFRNADFTNTVIMAAKFMECDLTGARFHGATLQAVKFVNCTGLDLSGATQAAVKVIND